MKNFMHEFLLGVALLAGMLIILLAGASVSKFIYIDF
jgi:hypothetical protein